jgi:hypothetical protein
MATSHRRDIWFLLKKAGSVADFGAVDLARARSRHRGM